MDYFTHLWNSPPSISLTHLQRTIWIRATPLLCGFAGTSFCAPLNCGMCGLPVAVFPGRYELGTFKKRVYLHLKSWQRTCSYLWCNLYLYSL